MVNIINRESLKSKRANNGYAETIRIFGGSSKENLEMRSAELIKIPANGAEHDSIVVKSKGDWVGSEGYHKLWQEIGELKHRIKNAADAPTAAQLAELVSKIYIDITKRAMESPDLTSVIATEITNLDFPEVITTKDLYRYIGEFRTVSGSNDSVPLIQSALGGTDTITLAIKALGWKTTLKNVLYNSLFEIQKVNEAAAIADVDERNNATIGAIVGATYAASQKQAADTTSGATLDVKMYYTLLAAIKKLRALKDYRTERPIAAPSLALLTNSADTWSIERVINGQLTNNGSGDGSITSVNLSGLPIANIIEYDQGMNNGFAYGLDTISKPGVTAGTAYLFVPREYFWVANKRPLTLETGRGSVLQLSQEERAWYRVQGEFSKLFFGSSYPGTSLGAGYGAVIEITLPS